MPTFAAVDIGSNSCRLKIASVQMHRLKTLHEDREVTRLGESVFQTGVISPEAMAATISSSIFPTASFSPIRSMPVKRCGRIGRRATCTC